MITIDDQLDALSDAELDAFPLGLVRLDADGKITYYNAAEAAIAHRTIDGTLGLNFFRDVAPCAAVQQFQGRFDAFVAAPDQRCSEPFRFHFLFGWGRKEVTITLVRRDCDVRGVYVVVERSDDAHID